MRSYIGRLARHMRGRSHSQKLSAPLVTMSINKCDVFRNLCFLAVVVGYGAPTAKAQSSTPSPAPPITLDEAIRRAQAVETTYGAAVADAGVAQAQRGIVRST